MSAPSVGYTLGHYRLGEKIGEGGMGIVFRAQDTHLEREVAVKILPQGALAGESDRKRFRKEALTLSKLNHPNIATIFDFDSDNGTDFLVEELIEGPSLDELLATGPLSEKQVIKLGTQLCDGLAAAHEHGIVHCDLKPANIRMASDGRLKILDFGIAHLLHKSTPDEVTASQTATRNFSGTLPYMAPEQLLNEKVDVRTDFWAAGCVLYELTTGRRPFIGEGAALVDAILHQAPTQPSKLNHNVSPAMEATILKCLEKDPDLRYASANDLAVDLRRLATVTSAVAPVRRRSIAYSKVTLVALPLLIIAALAAWKLWPRVPQKKAIAVLAFRNLSGDQSLDWLNGGLAEMLTTNLAQVKGMDVLSTEQIFRVLKRKGKDGSGLTPEFALDVARDAGAGACVTGSLLKVGASRLRVDVRVQDTETGSILFSEKLEGDGTESIFKLVDQFADNIVARFLPQSESAGKPQALEDVSTANLEAFRHYQLCRDLRRRSQMMEAVAECRNAVQLDPKFALAQLYVAINTLDSGRFTEARTELDKVGEIQYRLPRDGLLYYQAWRARLIGDVPDEIRVVKQLVQEFPRESEYRTMLSQRVVPPDAAAAVLRDGLALDPKDTGLWNQLVYIYGIHAADLEAALDASDHYQALLPNDPNGWDSRGAIYFQFGKPREAIECFRKTLEIQPDFGEYIEYWQIAIAYADEGQHELARRSLAEFMTHQPSSPDGLAVEAQLAQFRGDIEGSLEKYRVAMKAYRDLGQVVQATGPLYESAVASIFLGRTQEALQFTKRVDLKGRELPTLALLQRVNGDEAGSDESLQKYAKLVKGTSAYRIERNAALDKAWAALVRHDGQRALDAVKDVPRSELDKFLLGQAYLYSGDSANAEKELRRAIHEMRFIASPSRAVVREFLCHFYLGQVYEAEGKHAEAIAEYTQFLSRFQQSKSHLPQIEEARASLKRLERRPAGT